MTLRHGFAFVVIVWISLAVCPLDDEIRALIGRMMLEEKCSQIKEATPAI